MHPTAGATLVAARPPLVAFNLELAPPATLDDARAIAALIREGGEQGLPGVRAIGLWLENRGLAQVSTNVEDHRSHAAGGGRGRGRAARGRWLAPSSSASLPAMPSTASRPTCRCPATRRSRTRWPDARAPRKLRLQWHRPSASAAPSTAATPPARSRPAAAPAARRRPRSEKKQQRSETARQAKRLNKPPTWKGAIDARRSGLGVHVRVPAAHHHGNVVAAVLFGDLRASLCTCPSGYYLEQYLWRRRMRKKAATK